MKKKKQNPFTEEAVNCLFTATSYFSDFSKNTCNIGLLNPILLNLRCSIVLLLKSILFIDDSSNTISCKLKDMDYNETLRTFCAHYSDCNAHNDALSLLGQYETDSIINDADGLVQLICESFEFITNDLYDRLIQIDNYFKHDDFLDTVEPIIEAMANYDPDDDDDE